MESSTTKYAVMGQDTSGDFPPREIDSYHNYNNALERLNGLICGDNYKVWIEQVVATTTTKRYKLYEPE